MEFNQATQSRITETIKKAIGKFVGSEQTIVTDIHLQPRLDSCELLIYNDEDKVLAETVIEEWATYSGDDFYGNVESALSSILANLKKAGAFDKLSLLKPFSFVLVDEDKETISELLLMDDDTLLLSGGLLKGLDEELDTFLKDLLEK